MSFAQSVAVVITAAIAFAGALGAVARAVFKQASATELNTAVTKDLAATVAKLTDKVDRLTLRVDEHDVKIAVLQDRRRRPPP